MQSVIRNADFLFHMLPEIFSLRSNHAILIKHKSSWVWISVLFQPGTLRETCFQ